MHVGDGAWVEQMSGDSAAIWEGSRRGFDVENNRREGSGWDRAFGWALLRGDTRGEVRRRRGEIKQAEG